jgi:ArsR family transcriptional regulator
MFRGMMLLMELELIPVHAPAACCTPRNASAMSERDAAALAVTLKALADPGRLRLLSLLAANDGCESCVCDLVEPLGLSQPTVSHHLKVLVDAGLVTREKRGVWAYFTLVPGALATITAHLGSHLTVPSAA